MGRILVIDDNAMNLRLACDVLEMHGHQTMQERDGKSGVERARAELPDLILMDLRMPVLNGEDAMRLLKADPRTRDIPIVALTASAMVGECEKLLQRGFDGYISKPIDVASFAEKVEVFLQSAQQGEVDSR